MENKKKEPLTKKEQLKELFKKGKIPREGDFAKLIDHLLVNIQEKEDKVIIDKLQVSELALKVSGQTGSEESQYVDIEVDGDKLIVKREADGKPKPDSKVERIVLDFSGEKIWETLLTFKDATVPRMYRVTGKIFNPSTRINHIIFHATVAYLGQNERNDGIHVVQSGQRNGFFSRKDLIRLKWEEEDEGLELRFRSNQELKDLRLICNIESLWDDVSTSPQLLLNP
ncbi:MAG: hypothetical protein AAFR59_01800 [Bacteroidota bacterium]